MVLHAVQTAAIWLTAISVVISATPHLDCRCPNGRIKPYCLAFLTGKTGCCCDGSCCSTSPGDDAKSFAAQETSSATVPTTCCCCKAHQENVRDESRTAPRFAKTCCQKTLAVAAIAVSESSVQAPAQDLTTHLFVLAAAEQAGFGACDGSFDDRCHWPPPTDLITVLQRFLI